MTEEQPGANHELTLLGDDAILAQAQDRLGRSEFARQMAGLFDNIAPQTPSAVVGLLGPWGSGKTSVLHLVRRELEASNRWTVVEFNPWELSDLPSVIREFLATIGSAVPPSASAGERVRKALSRYSRKVAPLASILSFLPVDPGKALSAAADALVGDESLEHERQQLVEALSDHGNPVLVLIDDVDRLQADELTLVLKLVRLVGRLPNIYYALAFDEDTVIDVLEKTHLAAGDRSRALSYLEKIVQVRLDLPPPHPRYVSQMVDDALDSLTAQWNIELSTQEGRRLGEAYHRWLKFTMTEPRQVKRFFGQVEAVYPLVREEVDFVDFLLLTFVRTFFPEVYRILPAHKEELTGTSMDFGTRRSTPADRLQQWRERIVPILGARKVDEVLGLLGELFVPIDLALRSMGGGDWQYQERTKARRVGSDEYFDRYFYLGVGPDDIGDALVRSAVQEIASCSAHGRC